MSLQINTNIDALTAYRNLSVTQGQMSQSLERLSSGFRINRAADDAAGLAISQGLKSQVGGIKVAIRNTQDGINVVRTADGSLNETQAILQRMRDLAVQSANDSNDQNSRDALNAETTQLKAELDRIADKTTFNNVKLLDGQFTGKLFQVGYAANDTITVDISGGGTGGAVSTWANGAATATAGNATFTHGSTVTTVAVTASTDANNIASQLNNDAGFKAAYTASVDQNGGLVVTSKDGIAGAITVGGTLNAAGTNAAPGGSGGFSSSDLGVSAVSMGTQAGATAAISAIDAAIKSVSSARANLGALENRFQHTINNLNVASTNLSASMSSITDTDMASEMVNFTRTQILSQAGTAMLAQANQAPQSVLKLLQ